jgi:hypothetical protein
LKDADGVVRNGVLIPHGTGGSGGSFLGANYAGRLFSDTARRGEPHHPPRQRAWSSSKPVTACG